MASSLGIREFGRVLCVARADEERGRYEKYATSTQRAPRTAYRTAYTTRYGQRTTCTVYAISPRCSLRGAYGVRGAMLVTGYSLLQLDRPARDPRPRRIQARLHRRRHEIPA